MENKSIGIKLAGIDIIEKVLAKRTPTNPIPSTDFKYHINIDSTIDPDKKMVIVFTRVQVSENDSENVGALAVGFGYVIDNFDEEIPKTAEGQYFIPLELDNFVRTMSLNTARGIMHSEFRGTFFHNAILPIIVPIRPPQQVTEPSTTE